MAADERSQRATSACFARRRANRILPLAQNASWVAPFEGRRRRQRWQWRRVCLISNSSDRASIPPFQARDRAPTCDGGLERGRHTRRGGSIATVPLQDCSRFKRQRHLPGQPRHCHGALACCAAAARQWAPLMPLWATAACFALICRNRITHAAHNEWYDSVAGQHWPDRAALRT